MTTWQKIKWWLQSFRRVEGIELPDTGRSSIENNLGKAMSSYLERFGSVSPIIDFKMLSCLKHLWLYNPDLSQYVTNIQNLGNTGHTLKLDAKSTQQAEAALARLNEAAARIYQNGAGVDGLMNAYLAMIAWSGALSSEDVVNFPARRVERVVIVPPEQIRFVYNDVLDVYEPYQKVALTRQRNQNHLDLNPLNPNTYRYYALQTIDNNPYAKPPATAAVEMITETQKGATDNIKWMVNKLGLSGLVSISVTPPRQKPNETQAEYEKRATGYLKSVTESLDGNFNKGLIATFNDQKINHANVTSDARGAYDIFRVIEEQVFSGLGTFPAFHGRTDSTTETYADVVYNFMLAQMSNMQRLAKRRHEHTCRLDLRLGGIEVLGVSVSFNKAHARDPLKEAQAKQIEQTMILEKAKSGIISPDEAAQELGYESAYDPDLLSAQPDIAQSLQRLRFGGAEVQKAVVLRFRFDRDAQRYKFVRDVIALSNVQEVEADATDNNVVQLSKKKAA